MKSVWSEHHVARGIKALCCVFNNFHFWDLYRRKKSVSASPSKFLACSVVDWKAIYSFRLYEGGLKIFRPSLQPKRNSGQAAVG